MSPTWVRIFSATLGVLLWSLPLRAQVTASDGRPVLTVGALGNVILDGRLDEPAWSAADSIACLTEVEPREGDVPRGRTVVKVLADADALVIGVAAYQPDDAPAVSYARAPDSELRNEDHVQIVLDTFLDGRSGYVFSVNPAGARYDALISIQGGENKSWDGVWDAQTSRDGSAWFAEIWIPIRTLTFADGLERWGFNVERRIQSLQETDRWSGARPDYQIDQTSRAGYLEGLPSFGLGLGLSVRPAFTTGGGKPAPDTTFVGTFHPSLDVSQALRSNLLASLTVNTDFAETEVDTRRTNFTRFPLFFPEKRSFFLEGADIFDFGMGGQDVIPFFSRRIGLVEGSSVPLRVGGKVNGRVGGTSVGALVARTGNAGGLDTRATMGVLRLRQNVLAESTVGFMGAFGDPLGRGGSWMVGPDMTFQTSRLGGNKNFSVGAWGLVMGRDSLSGDRTAAGLRVAFPNDRVNAAASYTRIGEAFDPSLGFVPRPGVHVANSR